MVARLTGKIRNRPAWGKRAETAAGDEVEAEGKDAVSLQDSGSNGAGNVAAVFERGKINGTGGESIVERFPAEAGGAKFLEQGFVPPGIEDARFDVRAEKECQSLKSVQGVTAVEGVGIEVAGDDGCAGRNPGEEEF